MARLRIALFANPSNFAGRALEELSRAHEVVAIVRPARPGLLAALGHMAGRGPDAALRMRAPGATVLSADGFGESVLERLRGLRPDLACIAMFPKLVPDAAAALAPLGMINVHPSLLPRHRGPLPLFWTYHADDRRAGVTVHHATERFDAGDVLLQEAFELPRGYPVERLDADVISRGARMLREAAGALARGTACRVPQDESLATYAPTIRRGGRLVPFEQWDVERAWHFLAGLCAQYREPLVDEHGARVEYARVVGYRECATELPPGVVRRAGGRLHLHCRGGIVELAP